LLIEASKKIAVLPNMLKPQIMIIEAIQEIDEIVSSEEREKK
jgi:hypothetical protein